MNWPIWLPIERVLCTSSSSGARLSRLKNSMMPRTSLPNRIGNAKAPRSPAFAASGALRKLASRVTSVIQAGSPLASTRRSSPPAALGKGLDRG